MSPNLGGCKREGGEKGTRLCGKYCPELTIKIMERERGERRWRRGGIPHKRNGEKKKRRAATKTIGAFQQRRRRRSKRRRRREKKRGGGGK